MSKKNLLNLLHQSNTLPLARSFWGRRSLTVLAYHRITDPQQPGFDTFAPNVSATPANFAAQMNYVAQHFNVVSMEEVVAWLQNGRFLPPNPLLITFDDGYRDNLTEAFPILHQRQLPATIFLATSHIGRNNPFFWDLVAYCFHHTPNRSAVLPLLGEQSWYDLTSRKTIMLTLLRQLKRLPDQDKWTAVRQIPAALKITIPDNAFAGLHLTWDDVCQLQANGISMGAHTHTHPILTSCTDEQAQHEIRLSKQLIEERTGQSVLSFAYPNGQPYDYTPEHAALVAAAGIPTAFTLRPTPSRPAELHREPHTIRRILIDNHDTLPRFAAKVMGLTRLAGLPR